MEIQCHQYVDDENTWRALLQAPDRRMLENDEDGELLEEKDELDSFFKKIQSFCPLSCMHSDVKYLKTVITTEKNRLRRVEAKEKEQKEKQLAGDVAPVVVMVDVEQEKRKEAEKLAKANAIKDAIAASALAHTKSPNMKVGKVLSSGE